MKRRVTSEVTYTVQMHDEGGDDLWVEVQELPDCFASGDSWDELMHSLAEGIGLYLSSPTSPVVVAPAGRQRAREEPVVEKQRFLVFA